MAAGMATTMVGARLDGGGDVNGASDLAAVEANPPPRRRIWPPDGQIDRAHGRGGRARGGNRASSWQERPSWQRWWCKARGDGGDNRQ